MARILCIHGIGQELKGPETLHREWAAALRDGIRLAGGGDNELPDDDAIEVAFYGELFRAPAKGGAGSNYQLVDIDEGLEAELLRAWAAASAVPGAPITKSGSAPPSVQKIALAILRVPYFRGLTNCALVGPLKQFRRYMEESVTRQLVRERLSARISSDTRLIIAHSLGSIVAYEVLCSEALAAKPALITIGSPLGLPNLVFDRLVPAPVAGKGVWPAGVSSWTNIADANDIVAAVKELRPLFDGSIKDVMVNNGSLAHDIGPYFTAVGTGQAVLEALRAAR